MTKAKTLYLRDKDGNSIRVVKKDDVFDIFSEHFHKLAESESCMHPDSYATEYRLLKQLARQFGYRP